MQLLNDSERKPLRGLFQVYVVVTLTGEVFDPVVVVAESSEAAKPKALRKIGYLVGGTEYYDFVVRRLGDVRAKEETQEVRIVTDVVEAFKEAKRA